MRTQSLVWVAMAITGSVLFLAGCGSSDDKESVKPKAYPDTAAYCAGRAKAFCSDTIVSDCAITKDNCVVAIQAQCGSTAGIYRPDAAEICINTIKAAYTDAVLMPAEQASIDKDCGKVFDGEGVAGDTCTSLIDCDLDLGLECVRGKCATPKEVKAGELCDQDDLVCAKGYYCEPSATACVVQPGDGKPCNAVKTCADGFYCVIATAGADGTCTAKLSDGQDCAASSECSSGLCIVTKLGENGAPATSRCGTKHTFAAADPFCEMASGN